MGKALEVLHAARSVLLGLPVTIQIKLNPLCSRKLFTLQVHTDRLAAARETKTRLGVF